MAEEETAAAGTPEPTAAQIKAAEKTEADRVKADAERIAADRAALEEASARAEKDDAVRAVKRREALSLAELANYETAHAPVEKE